MIVDMSDMMSSIDTLHRGLQHVKIELTLHKPTSDTDTFRSSLEPFALAASPQIDKLIRMRAELQADSTSLLSFFGEGKDGKVEDLFGIISGFSAGLQKAAAEMSRHPLSSKPDLKNKMRPEERMNGQARLLAAAAAKIIIDTDDTDGAEKSGTSASSTLKALPAHSKFLSPDEAGSGSGLGKMGTMARMKGTVRGTLSKGELDEAIRAIHGGVTKWERTVKEGTMGRGGGVRLSKMFLDGKGSVKVPDRKGSGFIKS
jgi:diaphanous 1